MGLVSGVTLIASGITEASADRVVHEQNAVVVGPGVVTVVQLHVLVDIVWAYCERKRGVRRRVKHTLVQLVAGLTMNIRKNLDDPRNKSSFLDHISGAIQRDY